MTGYEPADSQLKARRPRTWPRIAAAGLLAVGVIAWSAAPMSGAGAGARLALIVAILAAACSIAQIALTRLRPQETGLESLLARQAQRIVEAINAVPWPELFLIAVLALEALHRSRPWHTAVLGVALVGDLLAIHLAETGAGATVLRRQVPVLAAGLGLCALAVGAAAIPSLPAGPVPVIIRVLAVAAAVIACGIVLPTWLGGDR